MQYDPFSDKPSFEDYTFWYYEKFWDDLESGKAERWHGLVTRLGQSTLEDSQFWQQMQNTLHDWDVAFKVSHEGYRLLERELQPDRILRKSFQSTLNKTFRRNVLENANWPDPPIRRPSTASQSTEIDPDDPSRWYGPSNWLVDFSDIFRVRLTTTYFDGVRFLAERVKELADQTTDVRPKLEFKASLDGYHAAHILSYHSLDIYDYENSDPGTVQVTLEVQVVTTIQETILNMLHRVYANWRLNGTPRDWEWDHRNPAFSVNYLGSTLHYLEGMIVLARDQEGMVQ